MTLETPRRQEEAVPADRDGAGAAPEAVAWEMIETGRYMPRRIRGSFRGRELG
jgi:hypothetical protein